MIKVLIIDDEPIIREGLIKTINWRHLQCEVIGETDNGIDAIDKMNELQPDIIITDIMMPGLSGLEMTKYIKENHPNVKIIFLTGYNDFNFAQQAIKLGAFDFVVKPTNTKDLENVITKAREQIVSSNRELNRQEEIRLKLEESLPVLRDKFITDFLFSKILSPDQIQKKMQFFDLKIDNFVILAFQIDNYQELEDNNEQEEHYFYMMSLEKIISDVLNRCKIKRLCCTHYDIIITIFQLEIEESDDLLKTSIISIAEEIRNKVENGYEFTVTVGISSFYKDFIDLKKAYNETVACLENRFYIGTNSTIHIDDLFTTECSYCKHEIETQILMKAIKSGNTQKVLEELDTVTSILHGYHNKQLVRNICIEIIVGCSRIYCDIYGSMEDLFAQGEIPFDRIMSCETALELFAILRKMMNCVVDGINVLQNSQTRKVITKALNYIGEKIAGDISLNDVAGYVYMSPWYFSKLFKKETKETFSEYILKIRIEKAKQLIRERIELKSYEIAELVGFNDSRYFGQIFKKFTGMTPTEYREHQ